MKECDHNVVAVIEIGGSDNIRTREIKCVICDKVVYENKFGVFVKIEEEETK